MRPHVERIASASHEALRVLGDNDRIAIMVFDRATRLRLGFRNSREAVERELESLLRQETFRGGTDITRGLLDAAAYVQREGRRDARRAIVILTDDQTEFRRDEAGVSRALARADAVLSALLAPDAMPQHGGYGGYPGGGRGGSRGGGGWPGGPSQGPLGGIILGRPRGPYGGRAPGQMGPRTQSAGTAEIAQRSGGDSMPVDDASALQDTLARIRQRYALHFNVPPGAKSGEERTIEVELSAAARRRYPDADIRYRRSYQVSGGGSQGADPPPTVITGGPREPSSTRAESSSADTNQDTGWRRRRVAESSGPREGPLVIGDGSSSSSSDAPAQPAPTPAASVTAPPPAPATQGGWRRVSDPAPKQ
jgi:VWA domain-containing protein